MSLNNNYKNNNFPHENKVWNNCFDDDRWEKEEWIVTVPSNTVTTLYIWLLACNKNLTIVPFYSIIFHS